MVLHELRGVVEEDGDGYIGHCDEVGTSSRGRTVEEAFANLRAATWDYLDQQAASETAGEPSPANEDVG